MKAKLYTCKMEEGASIQDYINKFDRIILDLNDIKVTAEDEDQALVLLLSLSKSYENLVQTLMFVGDTLTIDHTRASLLADDQRKVASSGMSTSVKEVKEQAQSLFALRGRSNKRGRKGNRLESRSNSRDLAERQCYKCGELGHFKFICLNKKVIFKKNNNNNFKRKQQEKHKASYVSDEGEECYFVSSHGDEISGK